MPAQVSRNPGVELKPARGTSSTHLSELKFEDLQAIQSRIKQLLPRVQPCVVAIDGGSGVIVSESGLILTASHVANRSGRSVNVTLSDGRAVQATTLGTNNQTDTSALQINANGPWPCLPLKQPRVANIGDWCLAFGYPSSFPRNSPAPVRLGRLLKVGNHELQTDCLLMGGDSGGPLISLDGELIGINSRVKNRLDQNYHIPASVFLREWNKITSASDVRQQASPSGQRAYLGLHAETDNERVRVRKVHAGSPAEIAGLKPEDVIRQFDGKPVTDFDEILEILEGRQPGEEVNVIVNRFGRLMRVYVRLGQQY
jgi:serine protease Do